MKKIWYILVLFLMVCPFCVNAQASISNTYISGINNKKIGEDLSVSFSVNVSDIRKGDATSLGIFSVAYEMVFDDSVFTITGIESKEWESSVVKTDGKYYVVSVVGDDDPFKNKCADGVLQCGSYIANVKFFINNTDKTESTIKMGEVSVGLLKMTNQYDEITEDDLIEINTVSNKSQTFNIGRSTSNDVKQPDSIVTDKKVENTAKSTLQKIENNVKNNSNNNDSSNKTNGNQTATKSNNSNLKTLEIENFTIDFDKNKKEYTININDSINSLNINALVEDEKASYTIIGNDDLKANNYQVLIEVTAEDGSKSNYVVNVSVLKDSKTTNSNNKNKSLKDIKIDKKYYVIGAGVLVILLIIFIISKLRDRKLDKLLNKL